jgi:VWFA-related protein
VKFSCVKFSWILCVAGLMAQTPPPAAAPPGPVIKTETRLVLVDTVVTDKKGNYIRDLTAKDFKVWEDNKEQPIKGFSFEADAGSQAPSQRRYLVLFFDNSTMEMADQTRARQDAAKFIEKNAGPNRMIAIVDFGGRLRIAQNFTDDTERLKKAVSNVKFSSVSPNAPVEVASVGMPSLGNAEADFGTRSLILGLRSMAKSLSGVPGRKTLVLFSSGFPLNSEAMAELTATIDMCNRYNVAIYPIDVRGLVATPIVPAGRSRGALSPAPAGFGLSDGAVVQTAAFTNQTPVVFLAVAQHGGPPGGGGGGGTGGGGGGTGGGGGGAGGSGGGGGRGGSGGGVGSGGGGTGGGTGGGAGGGRGGTGGTGGGVVGGNNGGSGGRGTGGGTVGSPNSGGGITQPFVNNPFNRQPGMIMPPILESASTNQQVLHMLADGTGGFLIANTNDLLGGLEKIGREQNEYYIIGYTPPESSEGSCHNLKVKVDRGGTIVRARSGYCNVKPQDMLAGTKAEQELENRAAAEAPGTVKATMQLPFFYTSANVARVSVAMEIPSDSMKVAKEKGKLHAEVNVMGIAYKADGAVAAKFSDTVKLDFQNKKEMEAFQENPLHYENQFDVASGKYTLKVTFTAGGENFGKLEMPLVVEPYDSKQFSLSAVALSKEIHRLADVGGDLTMAMLDDRKPLIAQGMRITPAGTNHFKMSDTVVLYVEIYEPLLLADSSAEKPPLAAVQVRIVDSKTGAQMFDSGGIRIDNYMKPGSPVIPVALKIPSGKLVAGSYRLELVAMDSADKQAKRTAEFEVE